MKKFQVIGCFTFRDNDVTKISVIRCLPPGIEEKLEKNHFLCLKTSFLSQNYTPLCISMVFKQDKNSYVQYFETSHFKNNCSNPPGESILLKFSQKLSNR